MAIERKDILFAMRAEDRATATFRQARKAVQDLTNAVSAQADGVRKGEVALEDLRDTYKELETVAKALANQQGLVDSLRAQTAALDRLGERATVARKKADDFGASLAGKAEVSVRAQQRFDRLTATADRLGQSFQRQQERIAGTRAALERAEIDVNDLDGVSKSLLATSAQVGQAFTTLNTTMSGYGRTMRVVRAEEKASADAAKQKADTIARVNAAMQRATAEQDRLVRAVRAAETASARDAAKNEAAVREETSAYTAQAVEVDRLIAARGRLSAVNVNLARQQGQGTAERSVQNVVSTTQGQRNLTAISSDVAALSRVVAENLGKPVANYLGILQDLERSLKNVQAVAKQVDGYQAQRAAVQATFTEYRSARESLKALNDEFKKNPSRENAAAVSQATAAYQRARTAFSEQLAILRTLREGLKQSGVEARNFGETEQRLVQLTEQTSRAIRDLDRNFQQFGGSRREGPAGFLGLRPYELQNLSYQVNDFFTQIASGTSVTQAFSQQIGQVAQIQPIWTRLVAFAPAFASLAASIGLVTAALSRMYETSSSNRNFEATLRLLSGGSTEGIGITAERMTALSRRLEDLGFDFDEVRKSAATFLREGLAPANLDAATEAAARLSRITGKDLTETTALLTRVMRGGAEAVAALREAGVGLNEEQRRSIVESGNLRNEFERQRQVLQAIGPTIRDVDQNALSPFTNAIIQAKNTWRAFLDEIGNTTPFQLLKSAIDAIPAGLNQMRVVGQTVARALTAAFAPLSLLLDTIRRGLGVLGRLLPGTNDGGPAIAGAPSGAGGTGSNSGEADGQQPVGQTAGQVQAEIAIRRAELEAIRDNRNRSRREREAAALELFRLEVRQQHAEADWQQQDYLARLRLVEFRRKLDEEDERRGRSGAAAVRRDLAAIQSDLQNTVRIRDEAIRGIQEDVTAGTLTPAQAIQRITEEADKARPAIERLRDEAQRFLDSGRGQNVVRDSAVERVIAQANRQLTGQTGTRAGTNAVLQGSTQDIQRQLQERQQFIQTQNALEQQGVITRAESERRIVEMYGRTNAAIRENIDAYEAASQAAAQNGQITQEQAAANASQVELWRAQLERINPEWARLKQGIENTVGSAAGTFFDSFAQSLGNVVAGVTSLGDAWDEAGQAALKFFADVLKGIAQVILQEQILQAVRFVTKAVSAGIAHGGAVVGASGGVVRTGINPAIFASAPRMHDGGVVGGLRRDERAAILQTGEEVLARDDPRNIRNAGGQAPSGANPATPIRNVLAIGDQEIASAMSGAPGEQVIMNILKRNIVRVRTMVRG